MSALEHSATVPPQDRVCFDYISAEGWHLFVKSWYLYISGPFFRCMAVFIIILDIKESITTHWREQF